VTNSDDAPTERNPPLRAAPRGAFAAGQRVFSRYTLEAQVGRGGMGVVWRARDEKLDRLVALKFLPPEVAADAEAVRDLKLETRRCLDLTHANIVRVYDFIEEESGAAIAMEYVEGESLAKIKAAAPGGCLAAGDLTPFVAQLCAALRYAHHVAKIAHHDLKPANVLVTKEGVLKVTDFGIARSLTETQSRLTAKAGGTSGTVLYMSPQQLAGERPTAADDIYALGALLYELVTGKPPFFRGDAVSLRQQVLEKSPPPLEAHRREVGCSGLEIPATWSATILACLAKQPGDRPASADDVASRLGVALDPLVTTRTLLPQRGAGADSSGPTQRSRVTALVVGGILLLGAAGTGIYLGVYAPEQSRLAAERERAHQAELALQAERTRQAEAQQRQAEEKRQAAEAGAIVARQKEEEARAQMVRDQQAYSAILATIAGLPDNASTRQISQTEQAIRSYERTAPEALRVVVEKAWSDRQAAWRASAAANRPGTLLVETDPPGATVVLYPRNERKTSPALFEAVKPGDVSLRLEKPGYEAKDVPFVVKPGINNKLTPVKLLPTFGSLAITSEPPDLYVAVEGNGRKLEGRTPFNPEQLPPGEYTVTYQQPGWRPVIKAVTVERGQKGKVAADLKGYTLEFRSVPPGAQLSVDKRPLRVLNQPVSVLSVEPRDYLITATLEGYEDFAKTITVKRNDSVVINLVEKPLPRALRKIAGARWVHDSFSITAELAFTIQGKITGTHHSTLGAKIQDLGTADSYNAKTAVISAHFAPGERGKAFYSGNVQIKQVDDDHLAVSWSGGSAPEQLVFARDKTPAK
jgi:hypothetical protein